VGRNRKSGERYPSGKLKPAAKPTAEPITGVAWQRIRTHAIRLGADPRVASELSRLNLFGELTIVQTTAGQRIGEIYGQYEALKGLRRSTRSPSYERAFGGARADSIAREEAEQDATEAFLELQKTLHDISPRSLEPLEQLCVEDRSVSRTLYPDIRNVLEYLAQIWGLTTVRRAGPAKRPEAKKAAAEEAPAPKKVNLDRQSWIKTIRTMRPDLTADQAGEAYDIAQALKHRAVFVSRSPTLSQNTLPEAARIRVAGDRPVLKLVKKGGTDVA